MIKLRDGQITDIMPVVLADQNEVKALSYALHRAVKRLVEHCDNTGVYAVIDNLPSDAVNMLAVEMRTQYYDETLDIQTRRELVKNTLKWHQKAGTPAAVAELVNVAFGSGKVHEWFEYGGEPYYFKIEVDRIPAPEPYLYFLKMINNVKNTRSHFECLIAKHETVSPVKWGAGYYARHRPAVIREGMNERAEPMASSIKCGTGHYARHRPAVIMEGMNEKAEPIYELSCMGIGQSKFYKNIAIEEE